MLPGKLSGVKLPHRKGTGGIAPVRMPVCDTVTIPLSMHIGAPAKCKVEVGAHVDVGDVIGESGGFVSAPIHSSVSGTVKKITQILGVAGNGIDAVVIESDGKMTVSPAVCPPDVHDYQTFVDAVRASGSVGLGGAGFPTSVKLSVKDLSAISEVIVNGAECEPYITSDTRTMIDRSNSVVEGCALLEKYLGVKKILIGIEKINPAAIASMKEAAKNDPAIKVCTLPALYPQGGEKVLIYNLTKKVVPEGKLPLDAGCIVINCTTLAFIADYIKTGMPLVEKCVTVDGSAVAEPKNVIVPIGTPISEIFKFCGAFCKEPKKVLMGGPMMGMAVYDLASPLVKGSNAVLAFDEKDSRPAEETACIRCGSCVSHCPLLLSPVNIAAAYKAGDTGRLAELKVNLCMECGCCSYICPARRPLVQTNKLAKAMLREEQTKNAAAKK